MRLLSKKRTENQAFSLIEVTIAMAIVAVAVVSLLGMIPQGLRTMRNAGDQAINGRIHQQILGELQLTPWTSTQGAEVIDSFNEDIRYYDDQGVEADISETDKHVYTARIHVPPITGGQRPPSLGGGDIPLIQVEGSSEPNRFIRIVMIEVAASSAPDFDFDDPANFPLINVFQTTITQLGREYSTN